MASSLEENPQTTTTTTTTTITAHFPYFTAVQLFSKQYRSLTSTSCSLVC
jgi:hypothetical protein